MRRWMKNRATATIMVTALAGAAGLFLRLYGKRGAEEPQDG